MAQPLTLLISLDGVAPRAVSTRTMPRLTGLAREGAACWTARTVVPSITLPAHTSLLHGVDPQDHGIFDNTPIEPTTNAPSVLRHARDAGLRTGAIYAWLEMNATLETNATNERIVFDSGYDLNDDVLVTEAAVQAVGSGRFDVLYVYLAAADLLGHDHGWLSDAYMAGLPTLDAQVGQILDAAGPDASVLVTTDHGGLGDTHIHSRPEDVETFVVGRSAKRITPGTLWPSASILDLAPTLCDIIGIEPSPLWQGKSLLGTGDLAIDVLMADLAAMADHHYGEDVNMLDHSLQTAALADQAGAHESLVIAALLHDIGHLAPGAGDWGLPSHAEAGRRYLQALLPANVWEPVGNHVDAKRYLVTTEPDYAAALSEASVITLGQQGGPFDQPEAAEFKARPGAQAAVQLRRWDDQGKANGLKVASLNSYRERLGRQLDSVAPPLSGSWARDACRCVECRDPNNDQHLIDVAELSGWTVESVADTPPQGQRIEIVHTDGRTHTCLVPAGSRTDRRPAETSPLSEIPMLDDWVQQVALGLDRNGIALLTGVATEQNEVLSIASQLGFVRETNYGRLFDVWSEPSPNNLAYSSLGLPLHTDNPYRDPCPTVQLLHCLQPADEGGASQFSDGFAAAERLRATDPQAFDVLATTPLDFRFHDDQVDLAARRTMIELDPAGAVRAVSVNHRSMEAPDRAVADMFYAAYAAFASLLNDHLTDVMLAAGDLVVFDNRRTLHGRSAFSDTGGRHLQGCYIDIDAVKSTARLAQETIPVG